MKWFQRKNLDEMQELNLLKLESRGFWIGNLGLLFAMAVQLFTTTPGQFTGSRLAGEIIVFLCMNLYLVGGCIHAGIWDRCFPATLSVNIIISLSAAAVTALFFGILSYKNYQNLSIALLTFTLQFIMLCVAIFAGLTITSALYRRKRRKLDAEDSAGEESNTPPQATGHQI